MSHHFWSTYLLSGTTNVPFLPYTTKWLFLPIPLGGHLKTISLALDVFCITEHYCFCRGSFHWTEQGNILKKDPLMFVIPIQYHRVLLSSGSYLDLSSPTARILVHNNISVCLFICPALQYTWCNTGIATPIPLSTINTIRKQSLRFLCRFFAHTMYLSEGMQSESNTYKLF